ncbi:MAG: pyruvate ferredoxin oxidoreductase [Chloroflexi bacterium]|jgi:pyruvate-ferredoxin/flavodoxin oxidoreductase|nr:pyruvate ferredoxin oxidoreductase [Chloroflexota bacterium]
MSQNGRSGILYPGVPTTADGSGAVVWVETNISQGAGAYPITSSTAMAHGFNTAVVNARANLWGEQLQFFEPESEHSAATICEGFALAGGRVTNFTSGQGLILMKEVLYTISGKRLPIVFHIGARALTSQSLNVHAGHDDVMGVEDVGWGMLFTRTAQGAADLALIARRTAEETHTPFFNVQDGFLTTHTVENIRLPEIELMREYIKNPNEALTNFFDPYNPLMTGVVQNQDSYMKGKIAQRHYIDQVMPALKAAMADYGKLTGREYKVVEPYRMEDADYAIVGMGSMIDTAEATVDWIRENLGIKVGTVHVTCFRPFPSADIVEALKNVKAFTVVERMDNPLAQSNPLAREIKAAFADALIGQEGYPQIDSIPRVVGGSAGLGSRDVRPGDIIAIVRNMMDEEGQNYFVTGIDHQLALKMEEDPDIRPAGGFSMRGHSVGGFGSVTTNKIIATIAGDVFGKKVQAYPKYGSEKKGLPTTYYLTVADGVIRTHSELNYVDFVPLNDANALLYTNPLKGLQPGGTLFVQTAKRTPQEVWDNVPPEAKAGIRENNIRVMALNAARIAREEAPTPDLEVRMQGVVLLGIFLKATPFADDAGLSDEEVLAGVEKAVRKYFGKRGEAVVQANLRAIQRGYNEVFFLPEDVLASDYTNPVYDSRQEIKLFV